MRTTVFSRDHYACLLKYVGIIVAGGAVLGGMGAPAQDLEVTTDTTLDPGAYSYEDLTVRSGATLTLAGDVAGGTGVSISATNITVEEGAAISANGQGYPAGEGPGAPEPGSSGAGHGGVGGQGGEGVAGAPYGSARPRLMEVFGGHTA